MDATTIRWLLGIISGILLVAVGALYARIRHLETEMAKLNKPVELLWGVVQSKMIKELHHPHTEFHQADKLLVKLDEGTIAPHERAELLELMEQRIVDPNPQITLSERKTAGGMAFVMEKVQQQEASDAPLKAIAIVGIKETEDEAVEE